MRSLLSFVVITSLVVGGCAAASQDDDDPSSAGSAAATEDPRISIAKNAKAIVFTERGKETALGAPSKIKAALQSMDGTLEPVGGAPRCGPPRFFLTINGADAQKIGTVNVCELEGESVSTSAYLQAGTSWYRVPFAENDLRDVLDEKPTIGDLLATATETIVSTADTQGTERRPAATYSKGFDLEALPEHSAANDHPPEHPIMTLRFVKGTATVLTIAVDQPANENDTEAQAMVTVSGHHVGWVTFDLARAIGSF